MKELVFFWHQHCQITPTHILCYIKLKAVISVVTALYLRAIFILLMELTHMNCVPLDNTVAVTDYQ